MAYISGQGGYVSIQPGAAGVGFLHNSRWTGNWAARLSEVTNSGSKGGTAYAMVCQDPRWTLDVPVQDNLFPEAVGLIEGAAISKMYFKKGASGLADQVNNTTVSSVDPVCDAAGDVIRVTVSGQGGTVLHNVSAPALT